MTVSQKKSHHPPYHLSREEVRFDVASEVFDGSLLEIVGDEIRENPPDSSKPHFSRDFRDHFFVRILLQLQTVTRRHLRQMRGDVKKKSD